MDEDWITPFESAITPILRHAGYEQIDTLTYKAFRSTAEVEHFIFFEEGGKTKGLFSGHFGVRNAEAEAFSANAILRYSGEFHFQGLRYDERKSCTMRFPFGRLVPPLWSIYVPHLAKPQIGEAVQSIVTEHMHPAVEGIITTEKLLSLLLGNKDPFLWGATNGAIRAAQIVVLGDKSGLDSDQIRSALEPHLNAVAHGFFRISPFRKDPSAYIDKILFDWKNRKPDGTSQQPG
jgi:hypothetical protein